MGSITITLVMAGRQTLTLLSILNIMSLTQGQLPNPLARWDQFAGGVQTVLDNVYQLDNTFNACGLRGVCKGMSLGPPILRRDGSFGPEYKGFLRKIVDGVGEVIFDSFSPLLEVIGLGQVARREVSLTHFVIDILDSMIIGLSRALGGRRLSRQLAENRQTIGSPILAFVKPVVDVFSGIPAPYIASIADLVVDFTGVANRRSGLYNVVRAGTMGYAYGDDQDDDVCAKLDADEEDERCVGESSEFDFLNMLNPINDNRLGETLRVDAKQNPLYSRTRNLQAAEYNRFEVLDFLDPPKALCKVNNVLNAVNGHIEVVEEQTLPPYFVLDDIDMTTVTPADEVETTTTSIVEIRVGDNGVKLDPATRLQQERDAAMVLRIIKLKEEEEDRPDPSLKEIIRPQNARDDFSAYCEEINMDAKKRYYQVKKQAQDMAVVTDSDFDETDENIENDNDVETINIKKKDAARTVETTDLEMKLTELETLARLGDRSVIAEKIKLDNSEEIEVEVEKLINQFGLEMDGKIENVAKVESRKGVPALLIQFNSIKFRDHVLRASRSSKARSVTKARLRRPKVSDLKLMLSLMPN